MVGLIESTYSKVIVQQNKNFSLGDLGLESMLTSIPVGIYPTTIDINNVTPTGSEIADFINFYRKKFTMRFSTGPMKEIMEDYFPAALIGFYYAKQNLDGAVFGLAQNGQFTATPITPPIAYSGLYTSASTSYIETWDVSVSAGWQKPAAPTESPTPAGAFAVNLALNGSGALQLYNNASLTVFGVLDQTSPGILEGVQVVNTQGNALGVEWDPLIGFSTDETVGFLPFNKTFILGKSDQLQVQANYNRAGNARPVLFGIAFIKNTISTQE